VKLSKIWSAESSVTTRPGLVPLATVFLRIVNLTFGSGATATALIREDVVERRGWIGKHQFALCYALARITPGTNLIAFCAAVAWLIRGWAGAILVLFAVSVPASAVVVLLSFMIEAWQSDPLGSAAIAGAMASVIGIIAGGAWLLTRPQLLSRNWLRTVTLVTGACLMSLVWGASPLWVIGLAAAVGYLWPEKEIV
jgi:chromate transporter